MVIGFGEDAIPNTKFLPLTFYKVKYIILSIYLTTFNNLTQNIIESILKNIYRIR